MKKTGEYLAIVLFCGFLSVMGLMYLILPEESFSEKEKRYLEEKPAFTAESVLSGDWGEAAEIYLADHMPGRDFFVGLNAYFDLLTLRQNTKEILKDGDCLLEAPVKADPAQVEKNLRSLRKFSEKTGKELDLLLIPSAGWYHDLPRYRDGEILDSIYAQAGSGIHPAEIRDSLDADCFYRTDHHWTSAGAYRGCASYMQKIGLPYRQDYRKETYGGFRGSTYSRSGLWLTEAEEIQLWRGSDDLTVRIGEETYDGIFFMENLQKLDKYTVFLGGNHPLVRIENPNRTGKLLVIRDSFSNCLGGFLAESFGEVTMVDLRYYKQPVSLLAEDSDRILVCYGLKNFLTDQNLVLLQR